MSGNTPDFVEHVVSQLSGISRLSQARFFGGTGLWADGLQFALLMGNTLYFCVDDRSRPLYEAMGSSHFRYTTAKRVIEVRKYCEVPAEVLDDGERLLALAQEAVVSARALRPPTMKAVKRKAASP